MQVPVEASPWTYVEGLHAAGRCYAANSINLNPHELTSEPTPQILK